MFILVLLAASFTCVNGQTTYCCYPDQWQGFVGEFTAAVSPTSGSPELMLGNVSTAYDYTNKRLATTSYQIVDGKPEPSETVISDYQAKLKYTIDGSRCNVSQLTTQMTRMCIPDNAIPVGEITYGVGSSSLPASMYHFNEYDTFSVFSTTTVGNPCVPISEILYGVPYGLPITQTLGYFDITPGITNPSVFTPPSSCNGLKPLKPVPETTNKLIKYIHAKVSK